eukprot:3268321-Rhodomonas_salina.1
MELLIAAKCNVDAAKVCDARRANDDVRVKRGSVHWQACACAVVWYVSSWRFCHYAIAFASCLRFHSQLRAHTYDHTSDPSVCNTHTHTHANHATSHSRTACFCRDSQRRRNTDGSTPLYVAACNGHAEAVDRLTAAKCNIQTAMVRYMEPRDGKEARLAESEAGGEGGVRGDRGRREAARMMSNVLCLSSSLSHRDAQRLRCVMPRLLNGVVMMWSNADPSQQPGWYQHGCTRGLWMLTRRGIVVVIVVIIS